MEEHILEKANDIKDRIEGLKNSIRVLNKFDGIFVGGSQIVGDEISGLSDYSKLEIRSLVETRIGIDLENAVDELKALEMKKVKGYKPHFTHCIICGSLKMFDDPTIPFCHLHKVDVSKYEIKAYKNRKIL